MNDEYLIYGETLTNIANSIRSVSNVSTTWTPDEMAAYILANLVKPTTRQAAKTYTPGTSNQTIPAGTFLTGAATIAGDADLAAANIVKGKNIFNVTGSANGIWGDPSVFYGFTAVKSGSFTPTAQLFSPYTVTHNLGVKPRFVFLYAESNLYGDNNYSTSENRIVCSLGFQTNDLTTIKGVMPNGVWVSMSVAGDESQLMSNTTSYIASSNATASNTTYWAGGSSSSSTTYNLMYSSKSDRSGGIYGATTSAFIINVSSGYSLSKSTYKWIVMG